MAKTLVAVMAGFVAGAAAASAGIYLANREQAPAAAVQAKAACANVDDLTAQVNALQEQLKSVPPTLQTTLEDGTVDESPNRLYEQLMLQLLTLKAEIGDATVCAGS